MRVLFIYVVQPPRLNVLNYLCYQHGIAFLSAILKKAGHKTALLYNYKLDKKQVDQKIKDFNPDLIAAHMLTTQLDATKEILNYIYQEYRLPIVLGGFHVTMVDPEGSLDIPGVIGVCRGEGEEAFLEFVTKLEKKQDYFNVKNFWFKKNGKIIKNLIRPLLQNLDELPFSDRELFDFQRKLDKTYLAEVVATRGCPYQCSHCINHAYMNLFKGKGPYVRRRSVDNFLEEIGELVSKYRNVRILYVNDETFGLDRRWLREFAEKYSKRFKIPFQIATRVDHLDEEVVALLKKAGCTECRVGIESGNDYIRTKILNRNITKEQMIKASKLLKETGITLFTFNMIGLPYETPEMIRETIDFNKKLKPDIVFVSVFEPFEGTKAYEICKKNNWISNRKIEGFFGNETVLDQPSITRKQVAYYHNIFPWCILYPKLAPIIKILSKIYLGEKSIYDYLFPLVKKTFEAKVMLIDRMWMNTKIKLRSSVTA